MKVLKKLLLLFLSLCIMLSIFACSAKDGAMGGFEGYYPPSIGTGDKTDMVEPGGETGDDAAGGETEGGSSAETGEDQRPVKPAGLITASAWNDNDNYAYWQEMFFQGQTPDENGKFARYLSSGWGFKTENRVKAVVKSSGAAVAGADVQCLSDDGNVLFSAKTDANGVAYLFPGVKEGNIKVSSGQYVAESAFSAENSEIEINLEGSERKIDFIELMFVVDVTGSMGDELSYLKTELKDVIQRVVAAGEQIKINLAFLFYRDHGDEEVFALHDFVNVNDNSVLDVQLKKLSKQYAQGGGDTPEAVDEALEKAVNMSWSETNSTKIIFHLLDAEPHSEKENQTRFYSAVNKAAEKGIRICPILASGGGSLCEYLVRQEAISTAGTFIFITDDSGIGNSHHDPELPNVTVEALNDLMVRLIDGYRTGNFKEPVSWKQR